jgi:hypothetical protein
LSAINLKHCQRYLLIDGNPNIFRKFYQYYEDGFNKELRAPPSVNMPRGRCCR